MSDSPQQQSPSEGGKKNFNKSHTVYKAKQKGDGCASSWQLDQGKECVWLEMAAQKGAAKQGENATFDWQNKLRIKLGMADLGELITVLERRQKGVGPAVQNEPGKHKGLFHKNATGSTTLSFEEGQYGGWFIRIGVKKDGGELQSLSHSVSFAEGSSLLVLLRLAIERIIGW